MRTYRHTHTHTRVRAWHGPGTTGDAPRHMHTRLDRQAAGPASTGGPSGGPRETGGEPGAQSCPCQGLYSWLLWATAKRRPPRRSWSLEDTVGAVQQWRHAAPPGSSRGARRHPGYPPDAPGFAGLPTTASSSCGIEFSTPSALRVSVPLGGKYKRCLCLKPNMGVRESPGLCPSLGPGLLATEGWAETRGRPPSYAQRGSCV